MAESDERCEAPRSERAPARGESARGVPIRRLLRSVAIVLAVLAPLATSCERKPSKSDYVSARVSETCGHLETTQELQACRIAVIKQFQDVPLEELQRRFPEPEPRARPSCSL